VRCVIACRTLLPGASSRKVPVPKPIIEGTLQIRYVSKIGDFFGISGKLPYAYRQTGNGHEPILPNGKHASTLRDGKFGKKFLFNLRRLVNNKTHNK
jgi:hypothetical protein